MDFCKCIHFVSKEDQEDQCECGHDIYDHLHQILGGCESRLD